MELSETERERLRIFLIGVYGDQVKDWTMNSGIFDLTFRLLEKSARCSELVDLVPRPMTPGQPPIKYISKQIRGILLRKLDQRRRYYVVCVKPVANHMRTEFWLRAHGH